MTVLVTDLGLPDARKPLAGQDALVALFPVHSRGRGRDHVARLPDQFVPRPPEQRFHRPVDAREPAVQRGARHRIVRVLVQVPVARLALAQRAEQARTLDRERGLVTVRLRQLRLVERELARVVRADLENSENAAIRPERHDEPRAISDAGWQTGSPKPEAR